MKHLILFSTQVVILKQQTSACATSTFCQKKTFLLSDAGCVLFCQPLKIPFSFSGRLKYFFWFTALRFLNSFESNLNKKFSRKLVRLCSHVEISKPFYYEFFEQTANFSDNFFFAIL